MGALKLFINTMVSKSQLNKMLFLVSWLRLYSVLCAKGVSTKGVGVIDVSD